MDWMEILAIVTAAMAAVILIVMLRRGWINKNTVTETGNLLDTLPIVPDDGFVGQLFTYVRLAVRAVEQMTKNDTIPKDDMARKDAACEMIERMAKLDGVELGEKDRDVIDDLVEAAVLELPKTE